MSLMLSGEERGEKRREMKMYLHFLPANTADVAGRGSQAIREKGMGLFARDNESPGFLRMMKLFRD